MSFYAVSALINAIASLFVGAFVYLQNRKDRINISFAVFSFFVFLWSVGYFLWQYATTPDSALLAIRGFMVASIFISTSFLHFVLVFVDEIARYRRGIILSYTIFFLFFLSDFTPWFVSGVTERMSFSFWPVPGPLFYPFFILWTSQVVFVLVLLYKAYKKTSGDKQMQLLYILVGTSLGFLGGSTNHFLWFGIPVPPIGNILVGSYVIAVAIAILKYQLFNVKIILVEIALSALNLFLFLNIFTSHTKTDFGLNISVSVAFLIFSVYLLRGVHKDIHDRERIEGLITEMKAANERLRVMEEQKTEFVSIASHQLRTPLTVIKGYASMLLEGTFGFVNDSARSAVENLYDASSKLVTLVEDLLTVSRLEQGRVVLSFETVNFKNFIEEILNETQSLAQKSKIDLSFATEEDEDFFAALDKKKFKQLVRHILENAIKYTSAHGSVQVFVMNDKLRGKARLIISDTGVGMTASQIKNFAISSHTELFHHSRDIAAEDIDTKLNEEAQPGLGLYIAREIIEAHRGVLYVESSGVGGGVTIVVEIPKIHYAGELNS